MTFAVWSLHTCTKIWNGNTQNDNNYCLWWGRGKDYFTFLLMTRVAFILREKKKAAWNKWRLGICSRGGHLEKPSKQKLSWHLLFKKPQEWWPERSRASTATISLSLNDTQVTTVSKPPSAQLQTDLSRGTTPATWTFRTCQNLDGTFSLKSHTDRFIHNSIRKFWRVKRINRNTIL